MKAVSTLAANGLRSGSRSAAEGLAMTTTRTTRRLTRRLFSTWQTSTTAPASSPSTDAGAPSTTAQPAAARRRSLHTGHTSPSNPAMAFPCLDALDMRSQRLQSERQQQLRPQPYQDQQLLMQLQHKHHSHQQQQKKLQQQLLQQRQQQQKQQRQQQQQQQQQQQEAATAAAVERQIRQLASLPEQWPSERGPEPSYTTGATQRFHSHESLRLDWGGVLREFDVAYETWGTLNADRSNAILLHTGLSASSHAHSTALNPQPGWWEAFIGPGPSFALDTNRFFVVCTNVLGGCYGSTGPSSIDPADGLHYATRFPIVTIEDMVRAQFRLLDALGINRLHASVGSSMGGMQSLAAGVLFPDRVGRIVSISGCARSHPYSIAMRHTQRQVLMMDPNWNRGFYYGHVPPHAGMKLAREIATVTYRSGPEWEQRFGRRRADPRKPPALCPDFLIETYLDHAGEKFCLTYDPNSLLYVSKAMDLFDLGRGHQERAAARHRRHAAEDAAAEAEAAEAAAEAYTLSLPDKPYEEQQQQMSADAAEAAAAAAAATVAAEAAESLPSSPSMMPGAPSWQPPEDLVQGLSVLRNHPTLVMGVASDILFPAWQQYEMAEALKRGGNRNVSHFELSEDHSIFGHDTFLLDLKNIGGSVRNFLD